jgi:hypothetical protein
LVEAVSAVSELVRHLEGKAVLRPALHDAVARGRTPSRRWAVFPIRVIRAIRGFSLPPPTRGETANYEMRRGQLGGFRIQPTFCSRPRRGRNPAVSPPPHRGRRPRLQSETPPNTNNRRMHRGTIRQYFSFASAQGSIRILLTRDSHAEFRLFLPVLGGFGVIVFPVDPALIRLSSAGLGRR